MSELLTDLRSECDWCAACCQCKALMLRAADEIEKLEAVNAARRNAMGSLGSFPGVCVEGGENNCDRALKVMHRQAAEIARLNKQVFDLGGINDAWALEVDNLKHEQAKLQAELLFVAGEAEKQDAEIERLLEENKQQQLRLDELTDRAGLLEIALAKAEGAVFTD